MKKSFILLALAVGLCFIGLCFGSRRDQTHQRTGSGRNRVIHHRKSSSAAPQNRKDSDPRNNTEVIAQIGGTAALRCHTQRMPDQLVTWMKRGDEQLLTAGLQVYSAEKRLSVAHLRHHKVWELRIRDVKASDAGTYDCQLTTHPPVSILVILRVVEARAVIKGAKELHVHEGSRLKLSCHVDLATEPPLYVFWFHNETMINFEAKRPLRVTTQLFNSNLTITNVSRADAGTYRCEPHKAIADNVTLHVIADENSAAMQKGNKEDGSHYAQKSCAGISKEKYSIIYCIAILMMAVATTILNVDTSVRLPSQCDNHNQCPEKGLIVECRKLGVVPDKLHYDYLINKKKTLRKGTKTFVESL